MQSDNYWLNTRTPCLTYGLRGIAYYEINITGPAADLHSGIYGGSVFEPMTALIALMSTLVDQDGHIKIEGVYKGIEPADGEELCVVFLTLFMPSVDSILGRNTKTWTIQFKISKARSEHPLPTLTTRSPSSWAR